jgi:hypothetical protein
MRKITKIRNIKAITSVSSGGRVGLEFLQAQTDIINFVTPYTAGEDYYIETRVKWTSLGADFVSFGSGQLAYDFYVAINNISSHWRNGLSNKVDQEMGAVVGSVLNQWRTIRFEYHYEAEEGHLYIDGVRMTDITGAAKKLTGVQEFSIGKLKGFEDNSGDTLVDWVNVNGEMFNLNNIIGGNVIGSEGSAVPIITDRADVNDMLVKL